MFCPKGPEPDLVAVQTPSGWFCVDSIEVTENQYADFLDQSPPVEGQGSVCAWNQSYEQLPETPRSALPRRSVDWCDARAYCKWAGKRLCGRPGGGSASYGEPSSAAGSEWYFACSRGGEQTYPYGSTFVAIKCVTSKHPTSHQVAAVGYQCEGGFAGLFSMSGNVAEWEDSCSTPSPAAECRVRGGSVASSADDARCAVNATLGRTGVSELVGIRCCADAISAE